MDIKFCPYCGAIWNRQRSFEIVSSDIIRVLCYKDYLTYTLYRN